MKNKIEQFVSDWNDKYNAYMQRNFPNNPNPQFEVSFGRKFAKVTKDHSVMAFVDIATGDVLKPASWAKPALHARGNVTSEQHGMEAINAEGSYIKYLR